MSRGCTAFKPWCVAIALVLVGAPRQAPAQDLPAAQVVVDTLFAAAGVPNVLAGFSAVVQGQLSRSAASLDPVQSARAREAIARHFAPARLREVAGATLLASAPLQTLTDVYRWLTSGEVADAREEVGAYRPPVSFDEFMSTLATAPPAQTRVLLMLRLAQAQGSGPFYLTLAEAARGAASGAARAIDPSLPAFQSLPEDQAAAALEMHEQQATLLFLYRYVPLPDERVAAIVARYESPQGQSYVDALLRAVQDAVLTAAERVADELRGRPDG